MTAVLTSFDHPVLNRMEHLPSEADSAPHVLNAAQHRLQASSHHFQRHVHCEYAHGVLRMTGRLPSFYLKQLAQSLVERVEGVQQIDNQIDVANPAGCSSVRSVS